MTYMVTPPLSALSGKLTDAQHGALGALANAHALADITGVAAHAARHNAGGVDVLTFTRVVITSVETTTTFSTSSTTMVLLTGLSITVTTASGTNDVEVVGFLPNIEAPNSNDPAAIALGGRARIRNTTDAATISGGRVGKSGTADGGITFASAITMVRLTTLAAVAKTLQLQVASIVGTTNFKATSGEAAADAPMTLYAKEYR